MDYNKLHRPWYAIMIFFITMAFISGCGKKDKQNIENTFYVELVDFSNDSLKNSLGERLFGKVSFFKNNRMETLSMNFVTEEYDRMHYYRNAAELEKEIKDGARKIRIVFMGNYSPDSISYALQKYTYHNGQWQKISDMGAVKATNFHEKARQFAIKEYSRQIANVVFEYSYN